MRHTPEQIDDPNDEAYEDMIQQVVFHEGDKLLAAYGRERTQANLEWLFDQIDERGLGAVMEEARLALAAIVPK